MMKVKFVLYATNSIALAYLQLKITRYCVWIKCDMSFAELVLFLKIAFDCYVKKIMELLYFIQNVSILIIHYMYRT